MGFSLKSSLAAAFSVVLLQGCVKTVVHEPGESLAPMRFGEPEILTRSLVTDGMFGKEGAVFNVWGTYHSPGDRDFLPTDIFDGTEITRTGTAWTYGEPRYWLPGFRYNFRALYPSGLAGSPGMVSYSYPQDQDHPAGNPDNAVLSIDDYDGRSGHDILYASAGPIDAVKGNMPAVALDFRHILSYIVFEGAVDPSVNRTVELVSARLYGNVAVGSWQSGSSPEGTWNVSGGEKATAASPYASVSDVLPLTSEYTSVFPEGKEVLMIPQTVQAGTIFEIQYRYTTGNTSLRTVRTDISSVGAAFSAWRPGSRYRYRFTIGDTDFIVFDTPSVTEWSDADGGNYIIQ